MKVREPQIEKTLTVAQVAELLQVNCTKVRAWIASGELKASNLTAESNPQRAVYRINAAHLRAFMRKREVAVDASASQPSPSVDATPRKFIQRNGATARRA